jgi:ParB family transcriptional regulator, chromosome partitioning protein
MRHDAHYVDSLGAPVATIGRKIAIDLIEPNPEQPRREIGDLSELSASIKEKGVLEPLLVKPISKTGRWMIIAGERRWRSAKLAGLTEVPCIEMDLDEQGVAEIALIENLQRKDLNLWEEADGLAALQQRYGYTQEEISKKISKSRTTVTEFLTIAGLPAEIRERCKALKVNTKSSLLEVARQFDEAAMNDFLDALAGGGKQPTKAGQTKRLKSVTPKISPSMVDGSEAAASSSATDNGTGFRFESPDGSFKVEVSFGDGQKIKRTEVLKALKAAFDAAKASEF